MYANFGALVFFSICVALDEMLYEMCIQASLL